jgi:SAM-dependent methyltransferase
LAALFCAALVVHRRLADSRPHARHLTAFYLALAAGGAAGGVFASLVAPLIFVRPFEYPLALLAALLVLPALRGRRIVALVSELGFVVVAVAVLLVVCGANPLAVAPVVGLLIVPVLLRQWRRTMVAAMAAIVAVLATVHSPVLYESRTFYGVNRVTSNADGSAHLLGHGVTVHGAEVMQGALSGQPLSYYRVGGPVDKAFATLPSTPRSVGIIGLGTGSLAAYARTGDQLTFYEIDPEVVRIAEDASLFTYLTDSPAEVSTVLGDGRLELAKAPVGAYDMVVLDAFSSDAVPVHLLTREAIAEYARHVSAGGILLFNLSNRYVDLAPVVAAAARDLGLSGCVDTDTPPAGSDAELYFTARWAVLSTSVPAACSTAGWVALPDVGARRAWTDDFSDIVSALR